ncbi:MAG: hypothetical protein QG641_2006 [Candidatus Poribacteria bacterium]|nr:hypothetical protein [Candidatus Poribacteria bacterium]
MPEKIRVAIVGAGGVANVAHAPAYAQLENVTLAAVCDLVKEKADALAVKYSAKPYYDVEKMLHEEKPDIVDICTKEHHHFEPAMQSLEAGCHVFCEKIMTDSLEKGERMVQMAKSKGVYLGVDFNYRFMPFAIKLKELIASRSIGELALINAFANASCTHHIIDLMLFFGGPVVEVSAKYVHTKDEKYHFPIKAGKWVYVPSRSEVVCMTYENEALGSLTSTTLTHNIDENPQWFSFDCIGETSRIMTDNIRISDIVGKLRMFPGNKQIELPDEKTLPCRDFQLAFSRSIGAFVDSVRQGKTPPVTGEDGFRALLIEEAIVVSHAQKCSVIIADGGIEKSPV